LDAILPRTSFARTKPYESQYLEKEENKSLSVMTPEPKRKSQLPRSSYNFLKLTKRQNLSFDASSKPMTFTNLSVTALLIMRKRAPEVCSMRDGLAVKNQRGMRMLRRKLTFTAN